MAQDPWSPEQYERFREERAQPFRDLLALVEARPGMRVIDLGCGTGEHTVTLHRTLGAKSTLGLDSSEAMLAKAQARGQDGLRFELGDPASCAPESTRATDAPFDLVFSNAALHWIEDHRTLVANLRNLIAPGGQLAVQVPANHAHPSQVVAAEVASEAPFREALGGFQRVSPVLSADAYAEVLHDVGFVEQRVFLRVYSHLLDRRDDVVEWVKGTTLTDYEKRMPAPLYGEFLESYRARLMVQLRDERPFFFPFQRILFWGRLSA